MYSVYTVCMYSKQYSSQSLNTFIIIITTIMMISMIAIVIVITLIAPVPAIETSKPTLLTYLSA